uniref:Myb-like domain-containing protein n=1 Tax=Brassica oleracea var. oleracea TaxID=109376 RepID=A0A0D3E5Q9_BRAOL
MDSNPYMNLNFVDLLQSQQDTSVGVEFPSIPFLSTQATEGRNFEHKTPSERKERRTWSPTDDVVLISSWLNTSKDPLVGNEQRSVAFWKRVAAYFEASPKVGGCEKRESSHCKQRWQKINDLVSKFAGAYEAATREKRSGQNENDVLKLAHEIFFTNHNKKFTLEHAWKELRNDQKWCALYTAKKCTAAIRVLAYGTAADPVDEYLRLGESTTRKCVEYFVEGIINLFGDEYLRRPTPADLQRLLDIGEYRGFPGMIGSIDFYV